PGRSGEPPCEDPPQRYRACEREPPDRGDPPGRRQESRPEKTHEGEGGGGDQRTACRCRFHLEGLARSAAHSDAIRTCRSRRTPATEPSWISAHAGASVVVVA